MRCVALVTLARVCKFCEHVKFAVNIEYRAAMDRAETLLATSTLALVASDALVAGKSIWWEAPVGRGKDSGMWAVGIHM